MGFPVGYSEVFIPTLFIHTLTFLTLLKKLLLTLSHLLGLPPDFLTQPGGPTIPSPPDSSSSATTPPPPPPPLSAVLLRELLPLVRVPPPPPPLEEDHHQDEEDDEEREISGGIIRCAVCLYDFCGGEEIRWLPNCKHIFHRHCLDRWMDLDHRTCPLCRTQFLPDHLINEFNQRLLSAHGFDDYHHMMYVDNHNNHSLFELEFSSL